MLLSSRKSSYSSFHRLSKVIHPFQILNLFGERAQPEPKTAKNHVTLNMSTEYHEVMKEKNFIQQHNSYFYITKTLKEIVSV